MEGEIRWAPHTARQRLANWYEPTNEDKVDVVGEVRTAHVGPGRFALLLPDVSQPVDGRFDEAQEAEVLDAFRAHRETRMRVRDVAEFSSHERQIRRFVHVDEVEIAPASGPEYGETVAPIWETSMILAALMCRWGRSRSWTC